MTATVVEPAEVSARRRLGFDGVLQIAHGHECGRSEMLISSEERSPIRTPQ